MNRVSKALPDAQGGALSADFHPGPAVEPTLVLIHGWTCRRHYWEDQVRHLSGRYPLLALDLPGHGDSPVPATPRTVEACAADVAAAVDAAIEGPVVLIGHSMGGAVALEAARALPRDRVAGVVLADTFVIDYGGLDDQTQQAIAAPFHEDFAAAVADLVENTSTEATPDALKSRLQQEMGAADPATALPLWASLLGWSPEAAFREVDSPIHAINGSLIPESARERCAPYVKERVQEGAGHFLQMEDPQRFNTLLDQSLAALSKR